MANPEAPAAGQRVRFLRYCGHAETRIGPAQLSWVLAKATAPAAPYRPPGIGAKIPESSALQQISPMDELTARLEAIMRRYAAACDQGEGDGAQLEFHKELQLLVAQYGQPAIDAALDEEMSDGAWPSVSLH